MTDIYENTRAHITARGQAYRAALGNPMGEKLLDDLAKFCRANESTFHQDARVHAVLEGRREVWLRIRDHLDMTDEELIRRYAGNIPTTSENQE